MKIGLVGYQGGGKSSLFELLTGTAPDPAKVHAGQAGTAVVPDPRFDQLVELFHPKKVTPAKIELLDTPGLSRDRQRDNPQRLAVIRGANALIQVIGVYAGADPADEIRAFADDCILADLQIVTNRLERLAKDVGKSRPDRDALREEMAALEPLAARLQQGEGLRGLELTDAQQAATQSFSLLSRKERLVVLNTAETDFDPAVIEELSASGQRVVAAPVGLELEIGALPEGERDEFAAEMGLTESCIGRIARAVFELTDQITFYTCDEKEVHAWLLQRGETAFDAAGTIHTDMARGFIRAEIMAAADLLRLGSEREVKAAGLHHVEGRDYVVRDGDEIVIRFNV